MKNSDWLAETLSLAEQNVRSGGWPFAAIVVKDGQEIARAVNGVHKSNDPSDHAEIAAIRSASNTLGSPDLSGTTMYILAPPCPMCMACMLLAKIDSVFYVVSVAQKDKALTKLPLTQELYSEVAKGIQVELIDFQKNEELKDRTVALLSDWNGRA